MADQPVSVQGPRGTPLRRLRKGFLTALLVGSLTAMVAIGPALFIQSVFLGSAQRCNDQQRFEEAALDEIVTDCEERIGGTPFWFPVLIVAVGGIAGTMGGGLYGYYSYPPPPRRRRRSTFSRSLSGGPEAISGGG